MREGEREIGREREKETERDRERKGERRREGWRERDRETGRESKDNCITAVQTNSINSMYTVCFDRVKSGELKPFRKKVSILFE